MSDIVNKVKSVKPVYIIGGGAIIGFLVFRHISKAKAPATDGTTTDTTGGDYTDPNTSAYGDYSAGSGASGVTPSLYGYQDPSTGAFIGGFGGNSVVTAPSTNPQWTQQASAYLMQNGFDAALVITALGKYELGQGLTNTELGVVQAAIGAEGYPPNRPPAPHVNPPTGHKGTPVPSGGLAAPHITAHARNAAVAQITWPHVPGAVYYSIYRHVGSHNFFLGNNTHEWFDVPRHVGGIVVVAKNGSVHSPVSNVATVK